MKQDTIPEPDKTSKEEITITPEQQETVSSVPTQLIPEIKEKKSKLFLGIVIGLFFSTLAAVGVYFFVFQQTQKTVQKQTVVNQIPNLEPTSTLAPTGQINWLKAPQILPTINVFKTGDELEKSGFSYALTKDAKFTKVAELSDGSVLINSQVPTDGPGRESLFRFLEKNSQYYCLSNYLDTWAKQDVEKILLPDIEFSDIQVEGINAPEKIEIDGKKLTKGYTASLFFADLNNPQKIFDTGFGPLYRTDVTVFKRQDIFVRSLFLRLKDDTIAQYSLDIDFLPKDEVPQISWNDNTDNKIGFTRRFISGCGLGTSGEAVIIKDGSEIISAKTQIGTTSTGQPVYQMTDPQNSLVSVLYNEYKVGRDYPGGPSIISIDEFTGQRNHFLWKDSIGDWQIFVNTGFAAMAECAKPVIYLYPKEKTEVSVKVGAVISKSEPKYLEGGWQVTAYPDGKIEYQDNSFPYLFWEGLGNGVYPNLSNQGFLVEQNKLLATLKNHLSLLGLNQKETADFIDFWLPKLPKTSYVRLTWLGTREMDLLAPLQVSPKPDTKIRIFLEYEGLNEPRVLQPQRLSSVKRSGFTLVEWGGLLIK